MSTHEVQEGDVVSETPEDRTAGDSRRPPTDDEIRATVARLARPHPKGHVIERAAVLAEGSSSSAIMDWIVAHAGEGQSAVARPASGGLHSARVPTHGAVLRYVLPAGVLG